MTDISALQARMNPSHRNATKARIIKEYAQAQKELDDAFEKNDLWIEAVGGGQIAAIYRLIAGTTAAAERGADLKAAPKKLERQVNEMNAALGAIGNSAAQLKSVGAPVDWYLTRLHQGQKLAEGLRGRIDKDLASAKAGLTAAVRARDSGLGASLGGDGRALNYEVVRAQAAVDILMDERVYLNNQKRTYDGLIADATAGSKRRAQPKALTGRGALGAHAGVTGEIGKPSTVDELVVFSAAPTKYQLAEAAQVQTIPEVKAPSRPPAELLPLKGLEVVAEGWSSRLNDQIAGMVGAIGGLGAAFDDVKAAVEKKDFGGAVDGVLKGFESLKDTFKTNGPVAGILAAATTAGKALGGTAGAVASGLKGGLQLGDKLGSLLKLAPGGQLAASIIGGVTGVLGALFGGNKTIGEAHLSAKDQQALQGVGTVLGDLHKQSKSISKSLETAQKYQGDMLDFVGEQVTYLRNISSNIGALTTAVSRQLSVGGALDTSRLGLGTTGSKGFLGVIGASSTTVSLVDQGVNLGSGSVADYVKGAFTGNYYQDTQTVKSKSGFLGIGGGTKTINAETTTALDSALVSGIGLVFTDLSKSVVAAAGKLGIKDAQAKLDQTPIELGRISLAGLTPEQVTEQLNAVVSKAGDQMAEAVAGSFASLQLAGEGMLETLQRLATQYTVVERGLGSIGRSLGDVGEASVTASNSLIKAFGGLDPFVSQVSAYQQAFLSSDEKMEILKKRVTDAMSDPAILAAESKAGLSIVQTKDQFKALVNSLDLTTEGGQSVFAQLMRIAPAFSQVAEAASATVDTVQDFTESVNAVKAAGQSWVDEAKQNVESARSDLTDAYNREANGLRELQDRMRGVAQSLGAWLTTLSISGDGAGSAATRRLAAQGEVDRLVGRLQAGDAEAGGALPSALDQFLGASRSAASSRYEYLRDVAYARDVAERAQASATAQVDAAEAQLRALEASVQGLIEINNSVLSVKDAISNLAAATSAQASAQFAASTFAAQAAAGRSFGAVTDNYGVNMRLAAQTGYTGDFGNGGFQNWIVQQSSGVRETARSILTEANQVSRIQGFATGGDAEVGGSGGPDSKLISMRLTPGELVRVRRPGQSGDTSTLERRLDAVIAELRELRSEAVKTARSTSKTENLLSQVTEGGRAMQTEQAA